jgi:Uma2 family endonuclease
MSKGDLPAHFVHHGRLEVKMASPNLIESPSGPGLAIADDALYEVVNGQRVEMPPMSIYASWIASQLHIDMGSFARAGRLGTVVAEALFILDAINDLRRRPDVAFVSFQTWPPDRLIPKEGDWEVIPDLAVEVSSPNDRLGDVLAKVYEYFAFGVRKVWLVVPTRQLVLVFDSPTQVRILTAADELDGGNLLPGFRLPVVGLFQHPGEAPASS